MVQKKMARFYGPRRICVTRPLCRVQTLLQTATSASMTNNHRTIMAASDAVLIGHNATVQSLQCRH